MVRRNYLKMTKEELSVAVNMAKAETSSVFKLGDLRNLLKSLNVPMFSDLVTTFISRGLIVRAGTTFLEGYEWKSSEPILKDRIFEMLSITRKMAAQRATEHNRNKKAKANGTPPVPKDAIEIQEEITPAQKRVELVALDKAEVKAVKLLLSLGYRITRPVIIYEEVTVK